MCESVCVKFTPSIYSFHDGTANWPKPPVFRCFEDEEEEEGIRVVDLSLVALVVAVVVVEYRPPPTPAPVVVRGATPAPIAVVALAPLEEEEMEGRRAEASIPWLLPPPVLMLVEDVGRAKDLALRRKPLRKESCLLVLLVLLPPSVSLPPPIVAGNGAVLVVVAVVVAAVRTRADTYPHSTPLISDVLQVAKAPLPLALVVPGPSREPPPVVVVEEAVAATMEE